MSQRALSPDQFRAFQANPKEMGGVPYHTVEAWEPEHAGTDWAQAHPRERSRWEGSGADPGHRPLGSISWHHQTGEIQGVYVEKQHQRQGIATSLYQHAGQIAKQTRGVTKPVHSADRTDSGEAWAKAVGGRRPPRIQRGSDLYG